MKRPIYLLLLISTAAVADPHEITLRNYVRTARRVVSESTIVISALRETNLRDLTRASELLSETGKDLNDKSQAVANYMEAFPRKMSPALDLLESRMNETTARLDYEIMLAAKQIIHSSGIKTFEKLVADLESRRFDQRLSRFAPALRAMAHQSGLYGTPNKEIVFGLFQEAHRRGNVYATAMISIRLAKGVGVAKVDLPQSEALANISYWHGFRPQKMKLLNETFTAEMTKLAKPLRHELSWWAALGAFGIAALILWSGPREEESDNIRIFPSDDAA